MVENQQDIYTNGQYSKVKDFFIGFFIVLAIISLLLVIIYYGNSSLKFLALMGAPIVGAMLIFLGISLKKQKRRYLGIGLAFSVILFFLIIFGSCFILITG